MQTIFHAQARYFARLALLGMVVLSGACSSGNGGCEAEDSHPLTEAEAASVRRQALTDAARVADAAPRSMEREGAILDIRAKEQALRSAGYSAAADLYVAVADSVLALK